MKWRIISFLVNSMFLMLVFMDAQWIVEDRLSISCIARFTGIYFVLAILKFCLWCSSGTRTLNFRKTSTCCMSIWTERPLAQAFSKSDFSMRALKEAIIYQSSAIHPLPTALGQKHDWLGPFGRWGFFCHSMQFYIWPRKWFFFSYLFSNRPKKPWLRRQPVSKWSYPRRYEFFYV